MADPVAYSFWAPSAQPIDYSGLAAAGHDLVAAYTGAGAAIREGVINGAKDQEKKKSEEAYDAVAETIEFQSNELNYDYTTVNDSDNDTRVSGMPILDRKAFYAQEALDQGYDSHTAEKRAMDLTQDRPVRVMKAPAREKFRALMARGAKASKYIEGGISAYTKMLEMNDSGAYHTMADAHADSVTRFGQTYAGNDAERLGLMKGKQDKEAADREAASRREAQHSSEVHDSQMQQSSAEIQRKRDMLQSEIEAAKAGRDKRLEGQLRVEQARLDSAMLEKRGRIDAKTQIAVNAAERDNKIAVDIAEQKNKMDVGSGGMTSDDLRKVPEISRIAVNRFVDDTLGKPESEIRSAQFSELGGLSQTAVADLVERAVGAKKARDFGLMSTDRGATKTFDMSRLSAEIGPDGQVIVTDSKGLLKPDDLERIGRFVFNNEQARNAVVMAQIYGPVLRNSSDLEQAGRINAATGAMDKWHKALAQRAQARLKPKEETPESEKTPSIRYTAPADSGGARTLKR